MASTLRQTCGALVVLGAVLGTLCSAPVVAAAQSLQEAKEAFLTGQEAYDRGDYAGAIAGWERSFALSQKTSLFYNIGLAYERMGKLEDAANALERFVSGSQPDDPYLDRGRARLALIRERLAQTGVLVACDQEGATILVDERDFGRTPRPDRIALAPGNHRIIVRKAGFQDFRSDVALSGGQELRLEVLLLAASGAPSEPGVEPVQAVAAEAPEAPSKSVLGPALTIGGGVVGVTGIVLGAVALGKAKDAQSDSDADSARTFALIADVSMTVGLAAAAVGSYLWFFADREAAPAAQPVAIVPRRDGVYVSAQVRF